MSAWLATVVASGGSMTAVLSAFSTAGYKFAKRFIAQETKAIVKVAVDELKVDVLTRLDKSDDTKQVIADRQNDMAVELAKQFGGNGGGIREAINRLAVDLGTLQGRFEQYTQEHKNGA